MRAVAAVIRNLPVEIRRVRVWRDQIYEALGAGGWDDDDAVDQLWPSQLQGPIRGRVSGMRMALDLTDWCQRRTYFTGRFYQEDLEELLSKLLRQGDNFVDVGANIGLVTLHAAAIVERNFWSFEPNPEVHARLLRHIALNSLDSRRVFNMGLGKEAGTLTMNQFGRHTGKATLVARPGHSVRTVRVEVRRGDEVLSDLDTSKPTVIKIDVEGFEVPVLEGLGRILDGNVAVVIEVSAPWLKRAGNSADELHSILESHGLKPHSFELSDSRMKRRLTVRRLDGPLEMEQYDCLFIRPSSIFVDRLRKASTFE